MARWSIAVVAVLGATVQLWSCSPCYTGSGAPAEMINLLTLSDGGMGAPCNTTNDCSAGLDCREVHQLSGRYATLSTTRACTRDCAGSPCPQGFACVDPDTLAAPDGGAGTPGHCVPACRTDADCRTGLRAGTCVGASDGGVDAGVLDGLCRPVICGGGGGGTCPSGFFCQDEGYGGGRCGYPNAGRAAPPPEAWCGKV